MSTIEIRDIHEPESELFIEELGKIQGGSLMTTLAMGEEDSPSMPSDPWAPLMGGIEQMLADAYAAYPDIFSKIPGYPGGPAQDPDPIGPWPVEPGGGIGN